LTTPMLCLNSPPEAPKNWGQINLDHNDYHSNLMEICSTIGYQISLTGGANRRKRTQSTPISLMWHGTYSVLYPVVSKTRAVFPFGEMVLAGDSLQLLAKHFGKKSE
jgi:hypothetical protein